MFRSVQYRVATMFLTFILLLTCCGCGHIESASSEPIDLFSEELATAELVVYSWTNDQLLYDWWPVMVDTALAMFRRNNPDVTLTFREFSYDEYDDILTVELMAGKGPDLILWENTRGDIFPDPTKTIQTNSFLDLNPLFQQDPTFSFDDYTVALDIGLYNGGRYYIPLNYFVTYTMVNADKLSTFTFPWAQHQRYEDYTASLVHYLRNVTLQELQNDTVDFSLWRDQYLYASGLQLIDYENEIVLPDREGLRMVSEFCKDMEPFFSHYDSITPFKKVTSRDTEVYFAKENHLFSTSFYITDITNIVFGSLRETSSDFRAPIGALPTVGSEKPVAFPGISAAIHTGTPNLQNAYQLLKCFLSESVQDTGYYSFPVHKKALYKEIESNGCRLPENSQIIYETVSDVLPYQQFSTKQWELYVQYMTPYWEGNASYEQCVSELENMLELYMYE